MKRGITVAYPKVPCPILVTRSYFDASSQNGKLKSSTYLSFSRVELKAPEVILMISLLLPVGILDLLEMDCIFRAYDHKFMSESIKDNNLDHTVTKEEVLDFRVNLRQIFDEYNEMTGVWRENS